MEYVILVDQNDNEIGTMEKMDAHRRGLLHRAFSILVFNSKGELLLQKKSGCKIPQRRTLDERLLQPSEKEEPLKLTAQKKLNQEMGIDVPLEFSHKFIYKASLDHGMTEHECDYVLIGTSDEEPRLNAHEAEAWKYASLQEIRSEIKTNPELFTSWFKIIMEQAEIKAAFPTL